MPNIYVKNAETCTGCRLCEMICSFEHTGYVNLAMARLRIPHTFPIPAEPTICLQCDPAPCVDSCPVEVLYRDQGIVRLKAEECILCGACFEACPYGAMFREPETDLPLKCDFCNGMARCVEICPKKVLDIAG